MKRLVALLLMVAAVLSFSFSMAENAADPAATETPVYATIDELPYLAQSRPDMTLAPALTVTVTDKLMLFAPASGKNDIKEPYMTIKGEKVKLKWNGKQKAYTLDYGKAGMTPTELEKFHIWSSQKLKKDKTISKYLNDRFLVYCWSVGTGECKNVQYSVVLKEKGESKQYWLVHYAKGFYKAALIDRNLLFEEDGRRIEPPRVTVPEKAEEIAGLPEMTFGSMEYHLPISLEDCFQLKTDATWEKVTLAGVEGGTGLSFGGLYLGAELTYDAEKGVWQSPPLSETYLRGIIKSFGWVSRVIFALERNIGEEGKLQAILPFSYENNGEWFDSINGALYDGKPFSYNGKALKLGNEDSEALTDHIRLIYEHYNQYSVKELYAIRTMDQLRVSFSDLTGALVEEKTYEGLPALTMLPREFPGK